MTECVICASNELGRRFGGNELCPEHWLELLEERPGDAFGWIEERRGSEI